MTREQFNHEMKYRAAMSAAKIMLNNEIITAADFEKVKRFFIEKFNPPLAEIAT